MFRAYSSRGAILIWRQGEGAPASATCAPRSKFQILARTGGVWVYTTPRATSSGSHAASGALVAQAATVVGSALHPHTSSGALQAAAAAVVGSASSLTTHAASGALVAQAATLAGVALNGTAPPEPDPAPPFTGVAGGGGMSNVPRRHQATIDAEEWEDAQRLRIQKDDEMVLDCITALVAAGVL